MEFILSKFKKYKDFIQTLNQKQISAIDAFQEKIINSEYEFEEVACLCGNERGLLITLTDRYGLSVPTQLCPKCSLMWTSKRLTQSSLTKFYQEDYRAIYVGNPPDPEAFWNNQVEQGKRIYEFVRPHLELENRKSLTIFEIGCGAGGILIPFKQANHNVFGCDFDAEYLEKGRDKGLILEKGEAQVLSKYGKADLIVLSHVLEHFPDPLVSLEEIKKLLKDDGYLYIEVPSIFNIHNSYKQTLIFFQNAHLYHFTLNTLIALMNKVNFRFIKGNQHIESLFQIGKEKTSNLRKESFWKILAYLYWGVEIERKKLFYKKLF